jgi:hypothetical protein
MVLCAAASGRLTKSASGINGALVRICRRLASMFSLTSRERIWIVLAALAAVLGAGIKHWRDLQVSRELAQSVPPAAAAPAR